MDDGREAPVPIKGQDQAVQVKRYRINTKKVARETRKKKTYGYPPRPLPLIGKNIHVLILQLDGFVCETGTFRI